MKILNTHSILGITILMLFASNNAFSACQVSRDQVLEDMKRGATPAKLSSQYADCTAVESTLGPVDGTVGNITTVNAIGQTIKNTGSTYWEALTSCGYQPQRKELTCPIEIRRRTGFGGLPALQPVGSYEFVLFCADLGGGLVPINTNGVHIHDEAFGAVPNWYFSAVVPANLRLFSRPLIGQTLRARAILSWGWPVAGCNSIPTYGNQADFRIRLDP